MVAIVHNGKRYSFFLLLKSLFKCISRRNSKINTHLRGSGFFSQTCQSLKKVSIKDLNERGGIKFYFDDSRSAETQSSCLEHLKNPTINGDGD